LTTASYTISGGDYESGGFASAGLKSLLKKIGADQEAIRRAMIAAYEAEMNVVIHARKGRMEVTVSPHEVTIDVIDEGPGIPDISRAMKEGFSTATQEARNLGFGAGMGLPNIRKNSNRFSIYSDVGKGTRVSFSIFLKQQDAQNDSENSLKIDSTRCTQCLACLWACPTQAIRLRDGKPVIHDHLCVDCTACVQACRPGAITMEVSEETQGAGTDATLVVPEAFFFQFGPENTRERVIDALLKSGARKVRSLADWEKSIRASVIEFAREEAKTLPVISPLCPAVINLIKVRYPSLLRCIAPFLTPLEAAGEELAGDKPVFIASCPGQRTFLFARRLPFLFPVHTPSLLRHGLLAHLSMDKSQAPVKPADIVTTMKSPDVLEATGARHVIAILEKLENGQLPGVNALELFLCDQGCFGTPLLAEDAFVAQRLRELNGSPTGEATQIYRRTAALHARKGFRLDEDMAAAVAKLARIEEITRALPGRNCGACGAPSCEILAEDITLGHAKQNDCVYLPQKRSDS
jgi:Na+-translocating ferredoxin:NAD+ oxidoreductase RNF subunit RnfB